MDAQTTAVPMPPDPGLCPIQPEGPPEVQALLIVGAVAAILGAGVFAWRRARARRDELMLRGTRRPRPAAPPPPGA